MRPKNKKGLSLCLPMKPNYRGISYGMTHF